MGGDTVISENFDAFDEINDDVQPVLEKPKKPKRVPFTVRDVASTKQLLDDLQWLKQIVVDKRPISQGDVVREALQLLAKKMNYDKLKEEYAEDLANATISAGRKTGR